MHPPSPENCTRLRDLARSFPALQDWVDHQACGFLPYNEDRQDEFMASIASHGAVHAILFVRSVRWGRNATAQIGDELIIFDMFKALGRWDTGGQLAFAAWAARPWSC